MGVAALTQLHTNADGSGDNGSLWSRTGFFPQAHAADEGGEGGEGGIEVASAAEDPGAFLIALDVIAAHFHAGLAALEAGKRMEGGEMFAHPIAEVYADMEDVFAAQGIEPFADLMAEASDLALSGQDLPLVDEKVHQVLEHLEKAEAKAPGQPAAIGPQAMAVLDLYERSAKQYLLASEDAAIGPYLDGFGFYRAAAERGENGLAPFLSARQRKAMEEAFAILKQAYPGAARPEKLPVSPGLVIAASSKLQLAFTKQLYDRYSVED